MLICQNQSPHVVSFIIVLIPTSCSQRAAGTLLALNIIVERAGMDGDHCLYSSFQQNLIK